MPCVLALFSRAYVHNRVRHQVAYAHAHALKADWYLNNCYCADPSSGLEYFEGDVKFLTDAGCV
jgi:hypothetical protein